MKAIEITDHTPIAMLTVGQLRQILSDAETKVIEKIEPEPSTPKNYVYGLAGIRKLFGVSHVTAQKYKDTIIADAVIQQGRKIIVDADYAMELFKIHNK